MFSDILAFFRKMKDEPIELLPAYDFTGHLSKNPNYARKLRKIQLEELKSLDTDGYVIKDNFFGEDVHDVRLEVHLLWI